MITAVAAAAAVLAFLIRVVSLLQVNRPLNYLFGRLESLWLQQVPAFAKKEKERDTFAHEKTNFGSFFVFLCLCCVCGCACCLLSALSRNHGFKSRQILGFFFSLSLSTVVGTSQVPQVTHRGEHLLIFFKSM